MGFLKSFFSGKEESAETANQKNFEILKYDGMRAQRMGRPDYAVKCFTEALALQEDFETMGYLSQIYIQTGELEQAHALLERMTQLEPTHITTLLTLANVCYMLETYQSMADAAQHVITLDEGNALAYYLLGRANYQLADLLTAIAHLTKAITLKEDFAEARLLRAEILINMQQYTEATEDLEIVLAQDPEEETAILWSGKTKEATGESEAAEACYRQIIELNPFNEQAFLYLGQLYIQQEKYTEAIELFTEAIELNTHFAQAYQERGRAKLLSGNKEGSLEDGKKALELAPKAGEFNGAFSNQPEQRNVLGL